MIEKRWVVQDRDSAMFLGSGEDGDMDFFRYINRAHQFETEEAASMTGLQMCDCGGFLVFGFLIEYAGPSVRRPGGV
jgi:hypothetical protein